MVSSTRTSGCTRLQHVQRETGTGTCGGSARAEAVEAKAGMALAAVPIEAVPASQGCATGLAAAIMGVIQVIDDDDDDDDDARPDTGPDVIGTETFWMPEKDGCSSTPFKFSNAALAELEPEE